MLSVSDRVRFGTIVFLRNVQKLKLLRIAGFEWIHIKRSPFQQKKYMLKVNNKNIRKRCEICSKLAIKIPERHHCTVYVGDM